MELILLLIFLIIYAFSVLFNLFIFVASLNLLFIKFDILYGLPLLVSSILFAFTLYKCRIKVK